MNDRYYLTGTAYGRDEVWHVSKTFQEQDQLRAWVTTQALEGFKVHAVIVDGDAPIGVVGNGEMYDGTYYTPEMFIT